MDLDAPISVRFTLDDGTCILLRPVRPADRDELEQGMEHLSMHSRLLRFFAPVEHLSEEQLHYLTDVDQVNHVAWGALDCDTPAVLGIGVGRFVQLEEEPSVAELAITVVDDYQHRGLGKVLFGLLYLRALDVGVRTLRAYFIQDNRTLADRLVALGGTLKTEDNVVLLNLPVQDQLPDTPEGHALQGMLQALRAALKPDNH